MTGHISTRGPGPGANAHLDSRRAFQVTLGLLATIPVVTGLIDIVKGLAALPGGPSQVTPSVDSAFRFASTFWCATGPVLWSQVPQLEQDSPVLTLTVGTIFLGGIARALSWRARGRPHPVLIGATALELIGMPALLVWCHRVSRREATFR